MTHTISSKRPLNLFRECRDYIIITIGLFFYALGWETFFIPYQITIGGVTGIGAVVQYSVGVPMQWTYFIINAVMMAFALWQLGPKFSIKTGYAIAMLTALLAILQFVMEDENGEVTLILGEGEDFMSCLIGAALCGLGLGLVFNCNGSTGGTDIIAAIINKYRDVTLGRIILICDVIIISSCYFIFHDWRRVIFGFVAMFVMTFVLDYIVNSARQSVQFLIFSKDYEKIADRIMHETNRGVTVLHATGWYSKKETRVLVVLAKKRQSVSIFRLVKDIDPNAFVSQSSVIGVYGEGFDKIKVK